MPYYMECCVAIRTHRVPRYDRSDAKTTAISTYQRRRFNTLFLTEEA